MNFKILSLFVALLLLTACASNRKNTPIQHTGTGILVINPITFNQSAYIREAVKKECELISKLTYFIEKNASSDYAQIMTQSNSIPKDAQVLNIEIEQVQGGGGGTWSGAKMVLLNGHVTKNGVKLGDFKARRYSSGGMFGGYKGTCAILGRCVRTLGSDIAKWLRHPTSKAVLGDL